LLADELPLRDVCDHHGNIDPAKWDAHWAQQDSFIQPVLSSSAQAARPPQRLPKKKLRRSRASMLWRFTAGQWVRKDPLESLWYRDYVVDPRQRAEAPDAGAMEKFESQFRRRFRMTYRQFLPFLATCASEPQFQTFGSRNVATLRHGGLYLDPPPPLKV